MEYEIVRILFATLLIAFCVIISVFIGASVIVIKKSIKMKRNPELEKQLKENTELTKLICDFMGYKIWKPWIARFKYFDHTIVTTPFGSYDLDYMNEKFRSDWGWLHEISNKIGKTPFDEVDGMREWMAVEWSDSKVNIHSSKKEVYYAIIKFIKWYNDNK